LPERLRWPVDSITQAERLQYQSHVALGVNLARKMGLSANAMLAIAQHHEHADGSGYPGHFRSDKISPLSHVVALVNHYDNLCNPGNLQHAMTPHEALALIFAQHKSQYEADTLTSFIRLMGIYPPGSVVQLTDQRYALVVSVNAERPIKPLVLIHNPEVPRNSAMVVNLEYERNIGIHRSLSALQLPKAVFDYLSPSARLCYYFGRTQEFVGEEAKA